VDLQAQQQRAALGASLALLAFAGLTTLAVIAWFARAADPWSWRAAVSAGLALTLSALVWREPTRLHVQAGIGVMLMSLLRVGPPWEWSWVSFTLLAITTLLMIPLVHAAIVLRS
jgi:hypothetical protein